ncbi:MAG: GatB/YqeY domain-containing protein [Candidatus Brennerbacteria bacterium]|nr:GatB/YqeY domain-containing protein [Candidatus Brennerbacteria bacterium]
MANLHERIAADAASAAKAGDDVRRDALRFLLASLHNRKIEKKGKGDAAALTDDDVRAVIEREAKKRKEAIEFFEKGGRPAQAVKERAELGVLEEYLPAALPDAEIARLIEEAIRVSGASDVKEMGKAMAAFRELLGKTAPGFRADAGAVSAKIKVRLSA